MTVASHLRFLHLSKPRSLSVATVWTNLLKEEWFVRLSAWEAVSVTLIRLDIEQHAKNKMQAQQ
jgi:hypothetical protein